jgi:transcriptional regulator with XRE-family HTH domain
MTPDELRAALARLGLSQVAFARLCNQSHVTVNRWLQGKRGVPDWLPTWMAMYELLTAQQRATIWP